MASDTATINVAAVNDAPVNVVPGQQYVGTGGTLTFSAASGNAIVITDADAGTADVTVTLSVGAGNGALTLATTAGLTTNSGNGTHTVTLTGSLVEINAALNGLVYAHAGAAGNRTLSITTNDGGNTGGGLEGDADTVAIAVSDLTVKQVIVFKGDTDRDGVKDGGETWTGDVDGDGIADPGDVFTIIVTIENHGSGAATNVSFFEDLDRLTQQGGVMITPIAFDDAGGAFTLTGNTAPRPSRRRSLANDIDPDTMSNAGLTITGVSGAVHGTVSFDAIAGTITFTPEAGYEGSDASFLYTVTDAQGLTSVVEAKVTLTVSDPVWYRGRSL